MKKINFMIITLVLCITGCSNGGFEEKIETLEIELENKEKELSESKSLNESLASLIEKEKKTAEVMSQTIEENEQLIDEQNSQISMLENKVNLLKESLEIAKNEVSPEMRAIQERGHLIAMDIVGYNRVSNQDTTNYSIMLDESLSWLYDEASDRSVYDDIIHDSQFLTDLYERDYYLYHQDGTYKKVRGEFENSLQPSVSLPGIYEPGIFVTQVGDYFPSRVNTHIWLEDIEGDIEVVKGLEVDEESLKESLDMETLDLVQYYSCDINGDGSVEYIVNLNDSYADQNFISNNWFKEDLTVYSSTILILDQNYNIMNDILTANEIEGMDVGGLFSRIEFVFDFDQNGIFEVLITEPVWEGAIHRIYYFDESLKTVDTQEFYTGI